MSDASETERLLIRELKNLNQRGEAGEAPSSGRESRPDRQARHLKQLAALSRLALGLAELGPDKDLYAYIRGQFKEIFSPSLLVLSSFDQTSGSLRPRAVQGLDQHLAAISLLLGREPVGDRFQPSPEAKRLLLTGELRRMPGGLYDLACGRISKPLSQAAADIFGVRDVFALGFVRQGQLQGGAAVITFNQAEPPEWEVLDTFMRLAALALQRGQVERALRQSEEGFRLIAENSSDLIALADLEGRWQYNNPAWAMLIGSPEELRGRSCFEGVHPQDRAGAEKAFRRAIETGQGQREEFRVLTASGEARHIECQSDLIRDQGGQVSRVLVVWRDVTWQRGAVEALVRSEKLYRNLFDSIEDLVYSHDLEGRFLTVNLALARTLGLQRQEIIGRSPADFMKPEYREAFYGEYLEQIKTRGHHEGTTLYFAKDGSRRYIDYRSVLVRSEEGEPYVSGSGRDITERILYERQVKGLQDQLLQSQKMEAIGALAGGVAHDFNNLLQAISGFVQLLLADTSPGTDSHGYLVRIDDSVARAADLVRRLLTFSRKVESETRPVDLNQAVSQAVKLLERTLPPMIAIETRLAADLRPVEADPAQLEQIIVNLASNAKDAMPEGGRLTLTSEQVSLSPEQAETYPDLAAGDYALLGVRDTGQGMDRETLAHLFEPFFTTKEVGQGTGLGLSMVYGIVKAHRGHVTCLSQPGQGTSFLIYLPLAEAEALAPVEKWPVEEEAPPGGETILLVDDEPAVLEVARQMLTLNGYQTLQARSGEEALEMYRFWGRSIGLVLLDLGMPGMGGFKCLEELLRLDPEVKVIVASGYTETKQAEKTLAAGALEFVAKPYRLKTMVQKIREVLGREKQG